MKKIVNPYTGIEGYNCFGCSPGNNCGLQLDFREDGDYLISEWMPKEHLQGYNNLLHGGIQATLMDEIASWCVQVKSGTAGVTSRMNVRYRKPVFIGMGKILLKAHVLETYRNLIDIQVGIYDQESVLCSEAVVTCYTFPEEVARTKYHYRGKESFYKDDHNDGAVS